MLPVIVTGRFMPARCEFLPRRFLHDLRTCIDAHATRFIVTMEAEIETLTIFPVVIRETEHLYTIDAEISLDLTPMNSKCM